MGAKESKPSCINYEDAIKRVSEFELRRLNESFKKSSGPGKTFLSQTAFQQDVLSEAVPQIVADLLYVACGGTSKGISFKDLLCGLVLLTRGSEDEKIRFLWNLYCNDSGTYILKSDYLKSLHSHSSDSGDLNGFKQHNTISLFAHSDRVNFEQFKEWVSTNKKSSVLSKWLLSKTTINLTSELETPTFYQSLAGVTHLEEQDIGDLEKEFWRLKNNALNGQLDLNLLGPLISPPIPKTALAGLFCAFDENRDGHIDFKELCCGVSAACRGPNVERCKFCFKVFDIDRDGILNNTEIKQMIDILLFVAKDSLNANAYKPIQMKDVIKDLLQFTKKKSPISQNFEEDIINSDFTLTQEDFMMWNVESTLNLIQPFLDLTFEVCHIVFGLSPQCRHMENDIVRGWLTREEKRGYKVGQFWYLISKDWWLHWMQFTQHFPSTPCGYCKKSSFAVGHRKLSNGVDEALVCDESFTSNSTESVEGHAATDSTSLGSGSSGISYGHQTHLKPGPIDNTNLVIPSPLKNIRTLTGEGGHLKKNIPLLPNQEFEIVPKSLWKALSRWYGDILPLPRQVIQPSNVVDVELELYPLNLRILLHQNLPTSSQSNCNNWSSVTGGYGGISSGGGYEALSTVPSVLQTPKRYLAYTAAFSRLASVKQIGEFLCEQLTLKPENIRLWHIFTTPANADDVPVLLEEENMTLKELFIKDNEQILLEIRNKDLTWPEELGSLSLTQNINQDRRQTRASIHSVHAAGATGLHNLGNTCFMNAALQVMFNTQPLTLYFKRRMHLFELNTTNKLGTRGQLATRYFELLHEILSATTRSVAPLKLRFCVTKYASRFAGGGQHDSQELLEWLLDALHEDLNRVTEKPYTELKDSDGRPDEIVAAEAWALHHSRNQSIVIDLFYGQLKSKVSCLGCGRESVRFDPFSLLSLPLPVENYTYFEVLVILLDGSIPTKYGLRMNSDSKYSDLKKQIGMLCHLNPTFMLVCELAQSQIRQVLSDEQKLRPSNSTELYVYQLPENNTNNRSRTSSILGVNIEKGLKDIQRSSALAVGVESINFHNNTSSLTPPSQQPQSIQSNNSGCSHCKDNSIDEKLQADRHIDDNKTHKRPSKQSTEISASPENTFVNNNFHHKRISATNLLHENTQSGNNSSDEVSIEKTLCDVIDNVEHSNNFITTNRQIDCPCRLNSDSCEDESNSLNLDSSLKNSMFNRGSLQYTVGRYLVAVHRKLTRQDTYFLSYHKTRPSLFGVPLLIPCYEDGTNKDVYCAVWLQVNRLLSPLPPTPDQSNHAADCDDSLGYDFPFTLRAVTRDGMACALCPWTNFCRGCEIPCNDDFLLQGTLKTTSANTSNCSTPKLSTKFSSLQNLELSLNKTFNLSNSHINAGAIYIAIDWDPTALHLRYQVTRERMWNEHETVAKYRKEQTEPVDLNHCLRAFTSEEKLEEWYHCSHCKGKKPATKKLQIWKLPPILIIHLKRFNCVNDKWVKSQKVVHFPFDNFDPTSYLASVPQETILRHRELLDTKIPSDISMCAEDCEDDESDDFKIESKVQHGSMLENIKNQAKDNEMNNKMKNDDFVSNIAIIDSTKRMKKMSITQREKRRRLESSSLTKTPIVDGQFKDYHEHKLKTGVDNLDLNYSLYAVVSHSGMLNGGHYISYAANPNGSWYCYNDSSCREIPLRPNIDPSSAYLLFYERRGLDYEPYMPNVDGKTIPNGNSIEVDDNENDLKKLCVIA